ncbi:unnamed protein product [Rhizoctonia solani]|uniref:DUF6593 domain-containing protein n=1 Tax=Rhizoctonia solani TaxID=456999 RepID=A0A8H3HAQ1_9AGAM|nr:unnamed protein product [Rhizoctonia solani]CAE6498615.1 unnamed protein product [Rhizoctonia solani]
MRGDELVAIIHWKWFERDKLTMNGKTSTISEAFPRPRKISNSRVYTMPDGSQFKWKGLDVVFAIDVQTRLNVAMYNRNAMYLISDKKSTLEIVAGASTELIDAVVVTWAIFEKKARDWRRSRWQAH